MKVDEFDYDLPTRHIAQNPLPQRDRSRLLVLCRDDRSMEEALFADLPRLLDPGDLIVVNDTRVAPFRLAGKKSTGGRVEITLTGRREDSGAWECLLRGRNIKPGMSINLGRGMRARVLGTSQEEVRVSAREGAPLWLVKFDGEDVESMLECEGLPPLPPYIRRSPGDDPTADHERYQTVYAREGAAAAAPTAGLHFTTGLIERLRSRGVELARVRLDVGWGTFAPVHSLEVTDHPLHSESYCLPEEAAAAVARARSGGSRVVAVGTTSVRVLEHCADSSGRVCPGAGETALFIYPGFSFRVVDAMVTNFHMPRSTLLMLVAAFAGKDFVLDAYAHALDKNFRFLSYGDAMLIL